MLWSIAYGRLHSGCISKCWWAGESFAMKSRSTSGTSSILAGLHSVFWFTFDQFYWAWKIYNMGPRPYKMVHINWLAAVFLHKSQIRFISIPLFFQWFDLVAENSALGHYLDPTVWYFATLLSKLKLKPRKNTIMDNIIYISRYQGYHNNFWAFHFLSIFRWGSEFTFICE